MKIRDGNSIWNKKIEKNYGNLLWNKNIENIDENLKWY